MARLDDIRLALAALFGISLEQTTIYCVRRGAVSRSQNVDDVTIRLPYPRVRSTAFDKNGNFVFVFAEAIFCLVLLHFPAEGRSAITSKQPSTH